MGSGGSKRKSGEGSTSSKQKKARKSGGKSQWKDAVVQQPSEQVVRAEIAVGGGDVNGTSTATQSESIENERKDDQSGAKATAVVTLREKSSTNGDGRLRSAGAKAARRTSFYDTVDAAEILPHLVIGNLASARNPGFLKGKNVGFILNLTTEGEAGGQRRTRGASLREGGIEQLQVEIEDDEDEDISGHFEICSEFINKAKMRSEGEIKKKHAPTTPAKTVLVHSNYGLSRTSAIVLAYLIKEKEWSLKEANEHLKKRHPAAKPNDGFVVQLLRYEQDLRGTMSMTMKDFYKQP